MNKSRAKGNSLIVIENGHLSIYVLDDKTEWTVGRPSAGNMPDICLHSTTVSRRHGRFSCDCGEWMYIDSYGKNGTVYKDKRLEKNKIGFVRPIMLEDKDVLIFGGGAEPVINGKTVWAMYVTDNVNGEWRVEDTKGMDKMQFIDGDWSEEVEAPGKGTVIDDGNGMAIYMGDLTYLLGDMRVREYIENV